MVIGYLILLSSCAFADTIYYKDGTTEKGLVVEEYYDRFILSTPDGEKPVLKSKIDEVFFDELYQNNLYIGRKLEEEGSFERALLFYQLALQSNSDFKEAEDAVKGLEDAKWRFGKSWRYRELKDILKEQLGIGLKKVNEKIVVVIHSRRGGLNLPYGKYDGDLLPGDMIISCWAKPLSYAGLKNSSRQLIGLSNTIAKLVIERDITIRRKSGFNLFPSLTITMEEEGPVVKSVAKDNPFYRSGLREGDLIIKIDGENTRYMKLGELKKRIFGGSRGKVLTIRRVFTLIRMRPENNKTLTAMWVWHSKEVLLNEAKKKELLEFCKAKNIGALFFQLQYQFLPGGQFSKRELSPSVVCRLLYDTRLRAFLKEAHSQGIKVHGLDGSPDFCLRTNHHLVLAQITAILDFNKEGDPQERFDGLHYDNEPYLLPAFNSDRKGDIINQFLELNKKSTALITSSGAKLEFGIDIPFWFDQLERLDAKLIDICDNVGIMDYRNFASGPDGIVALALDELKYAAATKKKVFVGVETSKYPEQEIYFVSILNEDEFNKKVIAGLEEFRFEGFLLRAQPYEKKVYLGLIKPKGASNEDFDKALSNLEGMCGRVPKPQAEGDLERLITEAMFAISDNPEFRDIKPQEYNGAAGGPFLMFIANEVMLEKLTFVDLTEKAINAVLAEAYKEFKSYPSFAGFAIHHYKSYKELCEKKKDDYTD